MTNQQVVVTEKQRDFDFIHLGLVPKIVDDERSQIFFDNEKAWDYLMGEAKLFLEKIPEEYKIGLEEKLRKEDMVGEFVALDTPHDFRFGFSPGYRLLMGNSDINCSQFYLDFVPTNEDEATGIIKSALDQFHLHLPYGPGNMLALEVKDKKPVIEGTDFLDKYLDEGTKVEIRCNLYLGNATRTHVVK
ncbi:hypothetical protein HON71_02665 [Candidatus Woesearchaeota archaeon]|nr:hypothetical protein [Candidatus Woesearchaeota archaeon]MBT5341967.1 hypothetical protein [Candidatus Woesearchaeota archaeon]